MREVIILIGHNKKNKGAIAFNGLSEYEFNSQVAHWTADYINKTFSHYIKAHVYDKNKGIAHIRRQNVLNQRSPYLCIELHFNSFKKAARGCEMLIADGNPENEFTMPEVHEFILADIFTDKFAAIYGNPERGEDGVKKISSNRERGWHNLLGGRTLAKYAFLFEPCFANFKNPVSQRIIEQPRHYSNVLGRLIGEMTYDFRCTFYELSQAPVKQPENTQKKTKQSCFQRLITKIFGTSKKTI